MGTLEKMALSDMVVYRGSLRPSRDYSLQKLMKNPENRINLQYILERNKNNFFMLVGAVYLTAHGFVGFGRKVPFWS